jgi:alpha-beta hydrolase superfamily lysophospholipase
MSMNDNNRLKTVDGIELIWRSWQADSPTGVIVLVHGLADHSARFEQIGQFLSKHHWTVYACDLRGHGLSSDGHQAGRVHVDHFSDYANDVNAMLSLAKQRHTDLPVILLGHSMGGLISLTYALNHPEELDGLLLSSPLLGTHADVRPPAILKILARLLANIKPRLLFSSNVNSNAVSRDQDVVRAYIDDPLVSEKVSARWFVECTKAIDDIQGRAAELNTPTLLMQSGDDRLVDPQAASQWAKNAPENLLTLLIWDELFHEMFNEPEKEKVYGCVLEWLGGNWGQAKN